MSERDLAKVLRIRSDMIKQVSKTSYDVKLREVMLQTAFTFDEAAAEIERLRARIAELETNSHTK